jgi:hypothetical protein
VALGDKAEARNYYKNLLEVAEGGTRQPALREAQNYLANERG